MKIVVLDGYTLNPGDLSWEGLEELGQVVRYDRTIVAETVERCRDAGAILTNKAPLSREVLAQLPNLRYIGVTATGYNMIDVEACKERSVTVCNVPAYSTDSVAQLVFAFILEFCHHVGLHSEAVHGGRWSESKDFAFWDRNLVELAGLTLGIVGYGNIGRRVAEIGRCFGMRVIAHSRTARTEAGVEFVDFPSLLRQADFISLHCPLTPETKGIINRETLSQMKETAFLVNTGRGPLIVEEDLAEALKSGQIGGAGVDVLSVEPPPASNPLLSVQECLITPHIAWATKAARIRLMRTTVENLRAFAEGAPQNVVA